MNERQGERLISAIEGLTEAINNSNLVKKRSSKPQKSIGSLAGEFTSKPIDEIPKAPVIINEKEIHRALEGWRNDFCNTVPSGSVYDMLLKTVTSLCQDAADGKLTLILPEIIKNPTGKDFTGV